MPRIPFRPALAAALAAAVAVAACGGGGDDIETPPVAVGTPQAAVFVAGDSLADSGTFGFRATVQGTGGATYPVYPEIVTRTLGAGSLCNYFSSPDGQAFTANAGCTNYAVGGSMVTNPEPRGGDDAPFSIAYQLQTAVAARGGSWAATDLLLLDGGANDAAALADAYLDARDGGTEDEAIFLAFLGQELSASEIEDAFDQPNGESVAVGLYLQQLAQTWYGTIQAQALAKGATRVAVVNVPDLTLTPRFRDRIAGIASTEGAAAADAFRTDLRNWVAGLNAELARLAANESRVVIVDYFQDLTALTANPAGSGLTNVTDDSCPAGDFPDCTDAAMDAAPPAGLAPGWWRTWYYSDGFHPSPRGHELLAASVNRALQQRGWQ